MKIEIHKVTRPLKLADYAPEYGEAAIQVWVNPPRARIQEHNAQIDRILQARLALVKAKDGDEETEAIKNAVEQLNATGDETITWFAEMWSQGPEDTRWTVEEVRTLVEQTSDTDPALWTWLVQNTRDMISIYRNGQKKA